MTSLTSQKKKQVEKRETKIATTSFNTREEESFLDKTWRNEREDERRARKATARTTTNAKLEIDGQDGQVVSQLKVTLSF